MICTTTYLITEIKMLVGTKKSPEEQVEFFSCSVGDFLAINRINPIF
jgi:hypothetical protein